MRYSIGDISRVLGLTTSALHFYEKEGIIVTPKGETGRRYYQEADINRLISAKKYRAMGVSVRDIAQQFSDEGMTGEQVLARIREKRDEARKMELTYANLARDIDRLIARSEDALAHTGEVDIRRVEDMLVFRSSSGGIIPRDKSEQVIAQRWMEAMPSVSVSICQEKDSDQGYLSLMIPSSRGKEFSLEPNGSTVRLIPGGMALHAVVICGEEQYDRPEGIFRSIQAFAQEHRFTQRGTMWGNQLFVDCSDGVRKHYYDTYMCFE